MTTQNDAVFEAIRSHILKYGDPPSMQQIMSKTKLPMKSVSMAIVRLSTEERIRYTPRDYSTIEIVSSEPVSEAPSIDVETKKKTVTRKSSRSSFANIINAPINDKRQTMVVDVLAAINLFDIKISELVEQKKVIDDHILVFEKAKSLLSDAP